MTGAAVFYGPPVVAWAAATYKLPAVRRRPTDRGLRFYWLTLTSLALALTLLVPSIYVSIDHLTQVPNLSRLLGDGSALVTAWSVQAFLAYLSFPVRQAMGVVRRLGYLLLAALVVLAVLFATAPVEEGALSFVQRSGDVPAILAYRLVFLGFLGLAAFNLTRLCRRYAIVTTHPALRLGLRLDALGGVVGLLYVTHEALFVLSRAVGVTYPIPQPVTVTNMLIALGVLLTVVGSTMPAWGPHVGVPWLYRTIATYRSLRRLYPLWVALYRATPEIALLPPPGRLADVLTLRDPTFRLYRRVIEIRDGRLALRPYADARVEDIVRDLSHGTHLGEDERRAMVEAAHVAAAIRRKAAGHSAGFAVPSNPIVGGTDISGEATALEQVAYWYARSSLVRDVVQRLDQPRSGSVEGSL